MRLAISLLLTTLALPTRSPADAGPAAPPADDTSQAEFEKWAASEDGKRDVAALTAAGTRLQFRLEAAAGDADSEEFKTDLGPIRVSKTIALNERAVAKAQAAPDVQSGRPMVTLTLTESGGRLMERITSKNVNRRLAVILDGKLVTAPAIRSAIRAAVQISVGTPEEAATIAKALTDATKK